MCYAQPVAVDVPQLVQNYLKWWINRTVTTLMAYKRNLPWIGPTSGVER